MNGSSINAEATVVKVDFVVKLYLPPRAVGSYSSHHMLEPLHDVTVVLFPTTACMCERK